MMGEMLHSSWCNHQDFKILEKSAFHGTDQSKSAFLFSTTRWSSANAQHFISKPPKEFGKPLMSYGPQSQRLDVAEIHFGIHLDTTKV